MYRVDDIKNITELRARYDWLRGRVAELKKALGSFEFLPQECAVTYAESAVARYTRNDIFGLNREFEVRKLQLTEFKITGTLRGSLKRALAEFAANS